MLPRALRTAGASLARRAATPSVHVQRRAGVRAFASEAGDKRENPAFTATTVKDMQGLDASLLLKEDGTQKDASLRHFTVNFGPQHPAAHGVLRLIIELNGEEILRVDVRISAADPSRTSVCCTAAPKSSSNTRRTRRRSPTLTASTTAR